MISAKLPHARVDSVCHKRGDGARPTDIGPWRTGEAYPVRLERGICAAFWRREGKAKKGNRRRAKSTGSGARGPGRLRGIRLSANASGREGACPEG